MRLTCRLAGRPAPLVVWYKEGRPVTQDAKHMLTVNESGSHALVMPGVLPGDSGVLGCIATNRSGEASFSVVCSVQSERA